MEDYWESVLLFKCMGRPKVIMLILYMANTLINKTKNQYGIQLNEQLL
ncbi:MAG: hypothetical protein Barrevirus9_21 [Barrevirus sp.]|uniref:Uncharacterized protein n=1 Tax=Barrevirus sp. TaxID=2487763 RepID=A0A3G4ZQ69_9VIRU|nr:MAG: hypothetical protein Barrevirus9_21 [Barrevirus sp.]